VRVAKIGVPASPQNKVRDHLMTRPEMPKKINGSAWARVTASK
jgi:hypothetical protein